MLSVEYHLVLDKGPFSGLPHLPKNRFEKTLKQLRNSGFVSLDKDPDSINKTLAVIQHPKIFLPTFDDSLKPSLYCVLSDLERYQYRAIFFVYTSIFEHRETLPLLERQRLLQYLSGDYRQFLQHFCRTALTLFPTLSAELYANPEGSIARVAKAYLNAWTFYSDEERYFRYLRDVDLQTDQFEKIIEIMFRELYSVDDEKNLFGKLFLDAEDLRLIVKEGHIVGSHSHTHPFDLRKLSRTQQRQELSQSKQILEDIIKQPVCSFAYPNGCYDESLVALLPELGFYSSYTTHSDAPPSAFAIPRVDGAVLQLTGEYVA